MPKLSKQASLDKLFNLATTASDCAKYSVDDGRFVRWHRNTELAITHIFGQHSRHLSDFLSITFAPIDFDPRFPSDRAQLGYTYNRGISTACGTLFSMIDEINEYWDAETDANVAHQLGRDPDRVNLLWNIVTYFNRSEIETMLFELGIGYDSLRGEDLTSKTRELILFCERTQRIDDLVTLCQRNRPNVKW